VIGALKSMVQGKKAQPSRTMVLGARPQRHPAVVWSREQGPLADRPVIYLRVPRRSDKFGNLVAKVFRLPEHRKIELDEIGSDVWEWCDGETGVGELSRKIGEKYRLNKRQSEASVTAYLKMLAERRLIGLRAGAPPAAGRRKQKKA
jgi:hypothetical protein